MQDAIYTKLPLAMSSDEGKGLAFTLNNNYLLSSNPNKKVFTCELCSVSVTSQRVLQRHFEGRKHKLRYEREGKSFTCELCQVTANSQKQLDSHLNSSRHKYKLALENDEFPLLHSSGLWILILGAVAVFTSTFLVFKYSP